MTRLNEEQLINLFHEPRTVSSFTKEPVTDEQLRRILRPHRLQQPAPAHHLGQEPRGTRAPRRTHGRWQQGKDPGGTGDRDSLRRRKLGRAR